MEFADTTEHIIIPLCFDFVTPFKNKRAFFNIGGSTNRYHISKETNDIT